MKGRDAVRRVDEQVRRRPEVLERMRHVPRAVPRGADAEREDREEEGEPQEPSCLGDRACVVPHEARVRRAVLERRV